MEAEQNPSSRHYQHKEGDVYHPHCIDKSLLSLRMMHHWCFLLIRLYNLTLNVYEKGQIGPRSSWRRNHGNYSTIVYVLSVLPELHNIRHVYNFNQTMKRCMTHKSNDWDFAPCEISLGTCVHPVSPVFAVCLLGSYELWLSSCGQWKLWSDCTETESLSAKRKSLDLLRSYMQLSPYRYGMATI